MRAPKLVVWAFGPLLGPVTRKFISRNVGHKVSFDNSRSRPLGVQYRSPEETFREHFIPDFYIHAGNAQAPFPTIAEKLE